MYDKFALALRLETTTNDVSSFKHHRKVEHRHGPSTRKVAPVKKSIYSLIDLQDILLGCNRRYLDYLSALDDLSAGVRALDRVTRPRSVNGKTVKPINFFSPIEQNLLRALQRPAFNIAGIRRTDLKPWLTELSPAALSRHIRRMRHLGLVKRIGGTYRYYPIATTSPRSAAPPSQPAATSPKTSSFRLSHDNFFAQNVKNQL